MKQQIITGLKNKLLLAELPEGANRIYIFNDEQPYLSYFVGHETIRFYLPDKCLLIGKLTDIKEEQFEQWKEKREGTQFQDHVHNYIETAKESFFSKLEADGIYFENPLGETPVTIAKKYYKLYPGGKKAAQEINEKKNNAWEEAQSKAWDINRCWLFEVI